MNRGTLAVWSVLAAAGTVAVWWLSRYLDQLVTLAETDRAAALALFQSRVVPALVGIVAVSIVAGGVLVRQGRRLAHESRIVGWMLAAGGIVMAAVPVVLLALVLWLLRRG